MGYFPPHGQNIQPPNPFALALVQSYPDGGANKRRVWKTCGAGWRVAVDQVADPLERHVRLYVLYLKRLRDGEVHEHGGSKMSDKMKRLFPSYAIAD